MATVAALDIGTNSTRLLIRRDGEDLQRRLQITRLGEGVDASRRLTPAAITRTAAALGDYARDIERHGVDAVRAVATSAVRDATNAGEFLDAAQAALGVRPEVIPGEEEGRLSFAGATTDLDPADGPFLVLDIGGGSTEFILGTTAVDAIHSADIGSVRLTEAYIDSDPPRPEELLACQSITEGHLDDVAAAFRDHGGLGSVRQLVGVAGTITTAAAVELGLPDDSPPALHGFRLTREAAEDVFRTLATEDREMRATNPGLHPGRVDVIVAGMCILVKVMRHLGVADCLVSQHDILDGVAAVLAGVGPAER
ncbi:MAG: Ppx/GppA phosphatase family protein [Acidimicrobiales bacterium]